jgi:hypothetical protein
MVETSSITKCNAKIWNAVEPDSENMKEEKWRVKRAIFFSSSLTENMESHVFFLFISNKRSGIGKNLVQ